MMRNLAFAGLILALAGCGNDPNRIDPSRFLKLPGKGETAPQATPGQMAQAALQHLSEPVMLAVLDDTGRTALLVPYGENGAVRTWTTMDRQTVSLKGGRVVATRGLGADLMSSTAAPPRPGQVSRQTLTTLNAANEIVRNQFDCTTDGGQRETITLASGASLTATRLTETCIGPGETGRNVFWIAGDGLVRQSSQWLATGTGSLTLQLLRP